MYFEYMKEYCNCSVANGGLTNKVFYLKNLIDVSDIQDYYINNESSLVTKAEDIESAILNGPALPIGDLIVNLSVRYLRLGLEISDEIQVNCGTSGNNMANIWVELADWLEENNLKNILLEDEVYKINDYENQTYILIQT